MMRYIGFSASAKENTALEAAVRNGAARLMGDSEWDICFFTDMAEASAALQSGAPCDILSWDVTRKNACEALKKLRAGCRTALLIVISDEGVSPITFLNPAVAPDTLLLRPMDAKEYTRAAEEALTELGRRQMSDGSFQLTSRGERRRVPLAQIYCFEARGKKIFLRLKNEEIGFGDTMDHLEENMPKGFRRCHRSFIVNLCMVRHVYLARNELELADGIFVPLSRSYKKTFKEGAENADE